MSLIKCILIWVAADIHSSVDTATSSLKLDLVDHEFEESNEIKWVDKLKTSIHIHACLRTRQLDMIELGLGQSSESLIHISLWKSIKDVQQKITSHSHRQTCQTSNIHIYMKRTCHRPRSFNPSSYYEHSVSVMRFDSLDVRGRTIFLLNITGRAWHTLIANIVHIFWIVNYAENLDPLLNCSTKLQTKH